MGNGLIHGLIGAEDGLIYTIMKNYTLGSIIKVLYTCDITVDDCLTRDKQYIGMEFRLMFRATI